MFPSHDRNEKEEYQSLLDANSSGKEIVPGEKGIPKTAYPKDRPENKIRTSLNYLRDTDWYVIRKMETGKNIPKEVTELREKAREEVSNGLG